MLLVVLQLQIYRCLVCFGKDGLILPPLDWLAPCVWPLSMFLCCLCVPGTLLSFLARPPAAIIRVMLTDRRCQSCHPWHYRSCATPLTLLCYVPCRSAGYTQKRLTEHLKVPYYVGEQFSKEFTGMNRRNLERTVEDDYISNLRNNCWKEKQQSTCASRTNQADSFIKLLVLPVLGKGLKQHILFFITSLLSYVFSWIVSRRGRHVIQSSLLWRLGPVPKSAEGSHSELRQAVRDHSITTRLELLSYSHTSIQNQTENLLYRGHLQIHSLFSCRLQVPLINTEVCWL